VPDGLVVDAESAVWVAMWVGGSLCGYASDGSVVSQWRTPVTQPTCPVVADIGVLYVTTA